MPTSGVINGSWSGTTNMTFRIDWSVQSQSVPNRTSSVLVKFVATRKFSTQTTNKASAPWTQVVGDVTTSGSANFDIRNTAVNADYIFRSETITVQHSTDGTASVNLSGSINLSGTSAKIGSASGTMVLPTIATNPPVINSLTTADAGNGVSTVGVYVAGKSKIRLTASATAGSGAISNYSFYDGSTLLKSGSSNTFEATAPLTAGSHTFKVIVSDVYGNTAERSAAAVTVAAYSNPTISTKSFRCNSSGVADNAGSYGSIKATVTFSAVGTNAIAINAVVNGSTKTLTSGTALVVSGLSTTTNYSVVYTATDSFGAVAKKTDVIQASARNFNLYPSQTGGAAFGGFAVEGVFDVYYAANIHGALTVNNGMPVHGYKTIASGTDLNTLTEFGWYNCGSATIANSLINCPVSGARFTLLVMPASITQQVIFEGARSGSIYTRSKTSSAWGSWYLHEGTPV